MFAKSNNICNNKCNNKCNKNQCLIKIFNAMKENTYCTTEQAEQLKNTILAAFNYEIDTAKNYKKKVNLTLIQAMIEMKMEIYK